LEGYEECFNGRNECNNAWNAGNRVIINQAAEGASQVQLGWEGDISDPRVIKVIETAKLLSKMLTSPTK